MAVADRSIDPRILDSARTEFLASGFEKASLKTICEGAGVTTGALYKRYKGKEDLFSAVWGRDSADTLKVVANTVSNLRRKMGGSQTYIRTVRGGYVFSAVSVTA